MYDFVSDDTQANRPKVLRKSRIWFLGNKSMEHVVYLCRYLCYLVEIYDYLHNIFSYPFPRCLVKSCRDTIRSRRRIGSHSFDNSMDFLRVQVRVHEIIIFISIRRVWRGEALSRAGRRMILCLENIIEISQKRSFKLLWSSSRGTIRIDKISNIVWSCSF
jgi:hypothetical protein